MRYCSFLVIFIATTTLAGCASGPPPALSAKVYKDYSEVYYLSAMRARAGLMTPEIAGYGRDLVGYRLREYREGANRINHLMKDIHQRTGWVTPERCNDMAVHLAEVKIVRDRRIAFAAKSRASTTCRTYAGITRCSRY